MKRILILIIGLFGVAQAQFAPTSAKTAFKNGISIGTRDSTAYAANDSLVVVINRQGRMMYRSTDGYWKLLANAASSDYVPYVGAVSNVFLGSNRIKADAFDLGIPSVSADSIGRMRWNADDLTMNIGLTSSVVLQSGQEMLILVKNQTGVTIPNGTVVRQSGVVGASGRLKVEPFLANGTHNSNQVLGLTTEDIPDGGDGFVAYFGKVNKVNTAAYPDSTILYASPTVAGGLTNVVPEAPNNIVKIGTVVKSAASNGIIFTRVVAGSNINQDEGVELTNPLNNSLLVYDSLTTLWKDKTLVEIGAVRVQDTAAMLAPYFRDSDTTGLLNNVVRTFGTQTVGGNKTFSNDIVVNGLTVGRGLSNSATNTAVGASALSASTTGLGNTVLGAISLSSLTTGEDNTAVGYNVLGTTTGAVGNTAIGSNSMVNTTTGNLNTAVGAQSLQGVTSGGFNVGIGGRALIYNTTGSDNIAIGYSAGEKIIGGANNTIARTSIFIGRDTKAAADNQLNQIVIGHNAAGNGTNTVTIGNSSVTDNYFTGNIRGGAFIRSGGTSSQFLKADGSVDGTSYATAASISGTTNYIPKFTSASAIGNSTIIDNGTSVNIGSGYKQLTISYPSTFATKLGIGDSNFYIQTDASPETFTFFNTTGTGDFIFKNGVSATTRLTLNGSGNLGLGVTPSAWSLGTAFDIANGPAILGVNNATHLTNNSVFNSGWKYKASSFAQNLILENDGSFKFNIAPSGTAGNPITFTQAMTLTANSELLINTTTTDGTNKLIVNGGIKGTSLSMSGGGSFGGIIYGVNGTTDPTAGTNAGTVLAFNGNSPTNNYSVGVAASRASAFDMFYQTGAINGGGYRWYRGTTEMMNLTKDAELLINTTTTDGTNKLIVNGGIKGTSLSMSGGANLATSSGNVGIGNWSTNVPQDKLHVNGAIQIGFVNSLNSAMRLFWNGASSYGAIQTASSSALALNPAGNDVLIGTTTPDGTNKLIVNGGVKFGTGGTTTITAAGAATFSSSVSATGFIVSSDRRLKNIIKRDGDVAYYKWKDKQDDKVHIGYIAQEVQKTNPDQVSENNGKLAVNYIEILVEKVRALEKEIEQLKRKQK